MRRIIYFILLLSFASCDDGDFEIPSFEFTDTVSHCGSFIVYRTSEIGTEALVLKLSDQNIAAEETDEPILVAISPQNVQYRIFDNPVAATYFCADLPPTEPIVIKNWIAVAGASNKISIETTAVTNDNNEITGYKHKIRLLNLVLENNGETMTFEDYYFGSFSINI